MLHRQHDSSAVPVRGVVARRLAALDMAVERLAAPLIAATFVLGSALVLARYPNGQNSDGLIPTLFSLQKMTLFFWGQDRFANLLPGLTVLVRDPQANAFCQLGLRTVLGMLSPLFFCRLATQGAAAAWRATLVSSALLLALAPQRTLHEAFIEASPYGTSLALAGLSLLAFDGAAVGGRMARVAWGAIALVLVCTAYLVNVSLALVAVPLVLGEALVFASVPAISFGLASLVAGGVAWALMAAAAVDAPTPLGFGETTAGLAYYWAAMLAKPGRFMWSMLLVAAAVLALLRWRRDPAAGASLGHGLILVGTFAVSFVMMALSSWVVANYIHPRYLVPHYILAAALGGVSLLSLAGTMVRAHAARDVIVLGACACLLAVAALRSPPASPANHDIVDAAYKPVADAVAAAVLERSLDGIAGSYWDVWPAVFQAEQLAHELGRPPGEVFGVSYRGEARRPAFVARLLQRGHLGIACIGGDTGWCNALLVGTMALPDTRLHVNSPSLQLPDGRVLSFLTIERPPLDRP